MKKVRPLLVLLFFALWSCDKQDLVLLNSEQKSNPDAVKDSSLADTNKDTTILQPVGKDSVIVPPATDYFNFIFKLNFNNCQPGAYETNSWKTDWNSPSWANHDIGYGNIISQNNQKFLQETFPKGTFLLTNVGTQWLSKLDKGYNELYFSYKVKFSKGFSNTEYNGKLPGLGGGSCASAGNLPNGTDGWSARYMFHGTKINFYLYYPDLYKEYGDAAPVTGKKYYGCGPEFNPGFSLIPETWYTVTQRIVLNNPGKSDGIVEGYINGKLCAVQKGIRFRDVSTLKIDYIFFANFFGGSGIAPLADENISFDDFYVYTYNANVNVARGNMANSAGTVISVP